jgi:hypothetical protein
MVGVLVFNNPVRLARQVFNNLVRLARRVFNNLARLARLARLALNK